MKQESQVPTRGTNGPPLPTQEPALGPLFSQLAQDSTALIKQEIALAKAEVKETIGQTVNGTVKLALAGALASVGGLVLTAFLVLLLGDLLDNYWLAALIVGIVFAAIGGILAMAGLRRFREVTVAPEQTIESLKEDRNWARAEMTELKRELVDGPAGQRR